MNPLDRNIFIKGFRKTLAASVPEDQAAEIWTEAGDVYSRILSMDPALKKHKGAMVLPCVALHRVLRARGIDAEKLLSQLLTTVMK